MMQHRNCLERTRQQLQRIAALDRQGPQLGAVVETHPTALAQARALDASPIQSDVHGLSVLIKDNIATADGLQTTAGSLALAGYRADHDAFVVSRLRQAGMLILGKTNLSEWANFRDTHALSGWSSRGGQTRNPHALDRSPWGSSSGSAVAVAMGYCDLALGTETDGSVVYPSAFCGIVGLKPTLGLVSRQGVIPLAHSQDTVGPMATSVKAVAQCLTVLAGPDPADPVTLAQPSRVDYVTALTPQALRGARLGVARQLWHQGPRVAAHMAEVLGQLQDAGAHLIDPVDLGDLDTLHRAERTAMLYEFRHGLEKFLGGLPGPVRSLQALIAFNRQHGAQQMPYFGQNLLEQALNCGPLEDSRYLEALTTCRRLAQEQGIDRAIRTHQLDALIAPTTGLPWKIDPLLGDPAAQGAATPAAVAGYPHITVPVGRLSGLPVGLSLFAGAYQEAQLLALAHGVEALYPPGPAPALMASVDSLS